MKTFNSKLKPARISFLIYLCLTLSALCFFASCLDEGDEEPSLQGDKYGINDIAGTWLAMQALFTGLDTPYKGSLDVIDEGGTLTLKIETNGRFKVTIVLPGEANMVFSGQLGFDEEWLAMAYDDEPEEYYYHYFDLNDTKTELTIRGDGWLDLDDDGVEDYVSINLILSKN